MEEDDQTMVYASIFASGYLFSSVSLISSNIFLCSYYVLYTGDAENVKVLSLRNL